MGEKNKDASNDNKKKKEKEETSPATTLIFNIDMHCDGCTNKITRCLRRFQALKMNVVVNGVESVKEETGVGKFLVDASKLRDKLTNKNKKNVDLSSSATNSNTNKDSNKKPKEKEAPVTTVVLKVALHCQGCIERIQNTIFKIKGVNDVAIDKEKETVTVKGTMDAKALVGSLTNRLKRKVEVVPPRKDNKDADKAKAKEKEKDKDKGKEKEGIIAGGKNKKKSGGDGDGEGKLKQNKMESPTLMPYNGGYGYDYNYGSFYMGQVHAPQIFSEENPNACSIM
ncbi:heavy metal-associated isoprenylated plant protein 3-like isoform X1 [Arachis duranensis]|uniref:Heavy metal-associated isoprenylated plant protein 3-like isoform X1 n=3 Tax=Arachis duranensis TaxID=130453 RepID=A0A6P4CR18_ARADU|nr:heavy metal-associated isoprenylated plant protein 3-like isoform X1 [Arachis duranensis]